MIVYVCPNKECNNSEEYEKPGKCPKCGTTLEAEHVLE